MLWGKKSYPPTCFGPHLKILFIPREVPFITPNSFIAIHIYFEQDGIYRQVCGSSGDIHHLYRLIKNIQIILKG